MRSISLFFILGIISSCASSVVIQQKYCPREMIYLSSDSNVDDEMEEVIWTPFAPFGKVTYDFKKNERCGVIKKTPLVFRDSFGSVLSSFIPFFSQTSIFYTR